MIRHNHRLGAYDLAAGEWQGAFSPWIRSIRHCLAALSRSYAAAVMYEQLSRLSDAELQQRGLSRQTLARNVFDAFSRPP